MINNEQQEVKKESETKLIKKEELVELKRAWLEYKKELPRFRKIEKKVQRFQRLLNQLMEKASSLYINGELSDMNCG